jgi:DNA-binding GntR family transcriptional regulator
MVNESYILFFMVVTPRHLTKTELALQALRERIRSGELRPGERLRVDELTRELGMSPTPIREALRLLQADRLVDYRPHHGIVVAEVSAETTAEVYHLRAVLEPLAVELAVPGLTDEGMAELERLHERHASAGSSQRLGAVADPNWAWHWAIYEASGWAILVDLIRQLWEAFPWRTMWALPGRMSLSLDEHEAVMAAIREGDPSAAAERMRAHVTSGRETLLAHLRKELSPQG